MKLDPAAFVADPALIQALERSSTTISCTADRLLFRQGEIPVGLYILNEGETTLTMTSLNGKEVVQLEACPGSLLGLPGLIGNEPYTLTAIAHKDAKLTFVPREEFTAIMQSNPQLALKILEVLAAEVRSARHALANR